MTLKDELRSLESRFGRKTDRKTEEEEADFAVDAKADQSEELKEGLGQRLGAAKQEADDTAKESSVDDEVVSESRKTLQSKFAAVLDNEKKEEGKNELVVEPDKGSRPTEPANPANAGMPAGTSPRPEISSASAGLQTGAGTSQGGSGFGAESRPAIQERPGTASLESASTTFNSEEVAKSVVTITADGKIGVGFLVDGKGKIATNSHLVDAATLIKVRMLSGDVFLAKLIQTDHKRDLAIVQIPTRTPRYLPLGEAASVDVGEDLFVFSNTPGKPGGMSKATITAIRGIDEVSLIQVNQAIAPGASGGPFVSSQGTVIGISSYRMGENGDDDAGFGVSVNELKQFISTL